MNATAANVFPFIPRIGAAWGAAGGNFAGTAGREHLIVCPCQPRPIPYDAAVSWIATLRHADFDDWRLPTIPELYLIRAALQYPHGLYWTGSAAANVAEAACVDLQTGEVGRFDSSFGLLALPVRRHVVN